MANIDALFPGKFLKAADLDGKDLTLTIASVQLEWVGQGSDAEQKPIMRFRDRQQALVLNVTNKETLKAMYGADHEKWTGKLATLYPTRTSMGGKPVDCIRIRDRVPENASPDAGDSDEPF